MITTAFHTHAGQVNQNVNSNFKLGEKHKTETTNKEASGSSRDCLLGFNASTVAKSEVSGVADLFIPLFQAIANSKNVDQLIGNGEFQNMFPYVNTFFTSKRLTDHLGKALKEFNDNHQLFNENNRNQLRDSLKAIYVLQRGDLTTADLKLFLSQRGKHKTKLSGEEKIFHSSGKLGDFEKKWKASSDEVSLLKKYILGTTESLTESA